MGLLTGAFIVILGIAGLICFLALGSVLGPQGNWIGEF